MIDDKFIYLDACATTPPHPDVIKEIYTIQSDSWGNPYSIHSLGLKSSELLERSRFEIKDKLGISTGEIIFTSGASESINLTFNLVDSIKEPGQIVLSSVEHPAVYKAATNLTRRGWTVDLLPVDTYGIIDLNSIHKYISSDTKFVSVIWGQNEIGSIQPISHITNYCNIRNIPIHIDATQILSQGVIDYDSLNVDFLSYSAHKLRGPKGVGGLVINDRIIQQHNIPNASKIQEYGFRAGTQPVPLVVGMSKAISIIKNKVYIKNGLTKFEDDSISHLTNRLRNELIKLEVMTLTGHPVHRLPHHLSYIIDNLSPNLSGKKIVKHMSDRGIFISSGSACSSDTELNINSTLQAIGLRDRSINSSIRFSLGPWLSDNDILSVKDSLIDILESY